MNLKSIMLSERNQMQKAMYSMGPFPWQPGKHKTAETHIRPAATWDWGSGEVQRLFGTMKIYILNMWWLCDHICLSNSQNYTPKKGRISLHVNYTSVKWMNDREIDWERLRLRECWGNPVKHDQGNLGWWRSWEENQNLRQTMKQHKY